jgi:hypothetical protein
VDELGGGGCVFDVATSTWRGTPSSTMPLTMTCVRVVAAGPIACGAGTDPLDQELSAADVHVTVAYQVNLLSLYFLNRLTSGGRVTVGASVLVPAAGR